MPPVPGPPAPEGAPNLKSSYLAHQGRAPPPPPQCRGGGGTPGGTSRPTPLRRPAAEGVPLRARRSAHRANWRVPQIILSGPPRQGPPPRCRGRRGMARSTPRRKPPRAPAPEGAPPDLAHRPQLEVLLSGPPWQGAPPPSMLGRRGHASNYPPSKALPPPGPARRAPSTPPPGPRRARRPSHRANWRVPTIPKMPTVPRAKPPGPPRRRHAPSKVLSAGPHGL